MVKLVVHRRLKISRLKGRAGSSPASRTNQKKVVSRTADSCAGKLSGMSSSINSSPFDRQSVYVSLVRPGIAKPAAKDRFWVRGRAMTGSQLFEAGSVRDLVAAAVEKNLLLKPMPRKKMALHEAPLSFEHWLALRDALFKAVKVQEGPLPFTLEFHGSGGVSVEIWELMDAKADATKEEAAAKKAAAAAKRAQTRAATKAAKPAAKKRA